MICRNIKVNGRRTSLRVEQDIWDALNDVARRRGLTVDRLASEIDSSRGESSLTGALRVYVLTYYRSALDRLDYYGIKPQPESRPLPDLHQLLPSGLH